MLVFVDCVERREQRERRIKMADKKGEEKS